MGGISLITFPHRARALACPTTMSFLGCLCTCTQHLTYDFWRYLPKPLVGICGGKPIHRSPLIPDLPVTTMHAAREFGVFIALHPSSSSLSTSGPEVHIWDTR